MRFIFGGIMLAAFMLLSARGRQGMLCCQAAENFNIVVSAAHAERLLCVHPPARPDGCYSVPSKTPAVAMGLADPLAEDFGMRLAPVFAADDLPEVRTAIELTGIGLTACVLPVTRRCSWPAACLHTPACACAALPNPASLAARVVLPALLS